MRRWNDNKRIPLDQLKIGDVIVAKHHTPTGTMMGPEYTVLKIEDDNIEVMNSWTKMPEPLTEADYGVDIGLTEAEIHARDFNMAREIALAMDHEMYDEGDAYHEMWNGWIDCDPYDMAYRAKDQKIMVLGWFKLKGHQIRMDDLDIGIVAEDETGDRFWCHAASRWFERWHTRYPELYEEE